MYALCVVHITSLDCRTCKVTTCCCTVTSLSGAISIVTRSAACVCHLSGASRQLLTGSPSSHLKLIHNFRPASPPGANMQSQRGSPFKPKPHDTRVPPGSDALALTHQQQASGKCSNAEDETTSISWAQRLAQHSMVEHDLPTRLFYARTHFAGCHDGLQVSCRNGVGVNDVVASWIVSTTG